MIALLTATAAASVAPVTVPHPDVRVLLRTTAENDGRHESEFFRALLALGRRQGLPDRDLTWYDGGEDPAGGGSAAVLGAGRAVVVRCPDGPRVVAILGGYWHTVPGVTFQQLVALDPSGRVTDRLACGINSRYGDLATEFPAKADDGSAVVVRFVPDRLHSGGGHNWHTVTHGGKGHTFQANERDDWAGRGLLRAALRGGKFEVLFPTLPADRPERGRGR